MFETTYRFCVLPRYRAAFRHAWQASHFSLQQIAGLTSHRLVQPHGNETAFTIRLTWLDRARFDRFTRTWFGVWLVNGMGLAPAAFGAPIAAAVACTTPTASETQQAA